MPLPEYKTKKTHYWQKAGDKIPYRSYVALLNQLGTNAPVATAMYNDLGEITYGYTAAGEYTIESNGLFVEDKTFFTIQQTQDNAPASANIIVYRIDDSTLGVKVLVEGSAYTDGFMLGVPIEIRIYN
jgi:hypothetical protein